MYFTEISSHMNSSACEMQVLLYKHQVLGFILAQYNDAVLWPPENVFNSDSTTCKWLIIGETVQNQDKKWLTTGIYQAKRATVFNAVQPTGGVVGFSFSLGGIVAVVGLVFYAWSPHRFASLNPFNASSYVGLPLFYPCMLHSLTTGGGIDYPSSDVVTGV